MASNGQFVATTPTIPRTDRILSIWRGINGERALSNPAVADSEALWSFPISHKDCSPFLGWKDCSLFRVTGWCVFWTAGGGIVRCLECLPRFPTHGASFAAAHEAMAARRPSVAHETIFPEVLRSMPQRRTLCFRQNSEYRRGGGTGANDPHA
jgi:hypothetical protein